MKKLLCLFGMLLPLLVNAQQIDSFSVAGQTFRFEIPKDWILEKNTDNVVPQQDWNIVIRHPVNTKCSYAYINIGFFRPQKETKTVTDRNRPYYSALVDSIDVVDYSTRYRFNKKKCPNKSYNLYNYFPINDSLYLVMTLFSSASDIEQANLSNIYLNFESRFKIENKVALWYLMPANHFISINKPENLVLNDTLKLSIPTNWNSKIETSKDTTSVVLIPTKDSNRPKISFSIFDSLSEYSGTNNFILPVWGASKNQSAYEKIGVFTAYRTIRILNKVKDTPNDYNIEISYTMDYLDEHGKPKHIVSKLTLTTNNSLTILLYANMVRGLLSQLIYNNNFSPN